MPELSTICPVCSYAGDNITFCSACACCEESCCDCPNPAMPAVALRPEQWDEIREALLDTIDSTEIPERREGLRIVLADLVSQVPHLCEGGA